MDYYSELNSLTPQEAAAVGGFVGGFYVVAIIVYVLEIIGMWKMFTKAGEKGWKSIIPIYNLVILYRMSGLSPWLILTLFIPIVNIVVTIYQLHMLSKSFGKGIGCTLALIFVPGIAYIYLGFGASQYVGPAGAKE